MNAKNKVAKKITAEKQLATSYKKLASTSFSLFSFYSLLTIAFISDTLFNSKSKTALEPEKVKVYVLLLNLLLINYVIGFIVSATKPKNRFLLTIPVGSALGLLITSLLTRLDVYQKIFVFLGLHISVNPEQTVLTTLLVASVLSDISFRLQDTYKETSRKIDKVIEASRSQKYSLWEEYYYEPNRNDEERKKIKRTNLLIQTLPIIPFVFLWFTPAASDTPTWVLYSYIIASGLWSSVWVFIAGTSPLADIPKEIQTTNKFRDILRWIDLGLSLAITILLTIMVSYRLKVAHLINYAFTLYLPIVSESLRKILSEIISYILSGIVGGWAWDKMKEFQATREKQKDTKSSKNKTSSRKKTG